MGIDICKKVLGNLQGGYRKEMSEEEFQTNVENKKL